MPCFSRQVHRLEPQLPLRRRDAVAATGAGVGVERRSGGSAIAQEGRAQQGPVKPADEEVQGNGKPGEPCRWEKAPKIAWLTMFVCSVPSERFRPSDE